MKGGGFVGEKPNRALCTEQQAARQSSVSAGVTAISGALADLEERITGLYGRLEPVLSPPCPTETGNGGKPPAACMLSGELSNLEDRVSALNVVVGDILARLEV